MLNDLKSDDGVKRLPVTIVVGCIVLLTLADVLFDKTQGVGWDHLLIEISVIVAALTTLLLLWWRTLTRSADQKSVLEQKLVRTRVDAEKWRARSEELLSGLGQAIQLQFREWNLTDAEQEVALLLLKGLSVKEIAVVRSTKEKTVRHQAAAVYSKSGLAGRNELSAFFLEDLLLPGSLAPDDARTLRRSAS